MQYISDFLDGTKDPDGTVLTTGFKGSTRLGYRSSIFQFLDSRNGSVRKGKDSTPEEQREYEKLAAKYLKGKVVPLADLKQFKDYLVTIKRPPHSISQSIACIRIWQEHYGFELTSKELKELKKHMPIQRHAVTREGELTPEVLRDVLSHTGDARLKASILLMATSGLRIGELIELTTDDIDMKRNMIYVSDLVAKTGVDRRTFFTDEAKDALNAYLKERGAYINRSKTYTPRLKKEFKESKRIFATTTNVIRVAMINALKKSGHHNSDPRTNRGQIHPHSLRKYFSSTLKLAGMQEDLVEYLMGHSTGISNAYRTYSAAQLREQYLKFEFCLHVDYSYTAQKELRSQIGDADTRIKELTDQNTDLKKRLELVESKAKDPEVSKLKAQVNEMESMIEKLVKMVNSLAPESFPQ
jgi:integrase